MPRGPPLPPSGLQEKASSAHPAQPRRPPRARLTTEGQDPLPHIVQQQAVPPPPTKQQHRLPPILILHRQRIDTCIVSKGCQAVLIDRQAGTSAGWMARWATPQRLLRPAHACSCSWRAYRDLPASPPTPPRSWPGCGPCEGWEQAPRGSTHTRRCCRCTGRRTPAASGAPAGAAARHPPCCCCRAAACPCWRAGAHPRRAPACPGLRRALPRPASERWAGAERAGAAGGAAASAATSPAADAAAAVALHCAGRPAVALPTRGLPTAQEAAGAAAAGSVAAAVAASPCLSACAS